MKNSIEATATPDDDFNKWDSLFRQYGAMYRVPWRWMKAIAIQESRLGKAKSVAWGLVHPTDVANSVSFDGKSWGLMQVTLATGRALEGSAVDAAFLNNPTNSVRLAAKLLRELVDRFGIDRREAIIRSYNGGPSKGPTNPLTLPYYGFFLTNINVVLAKNPGFELEGYV